MTELIETTISAESMTQKKNEAFWDDFDKENY